jgi:hypothetical protein
MAGEQQVPHGHDQPVSKEQHTAKVVELAEVKGQLEQVRVRHERLIDEYSALYAEHTTAGREGVHLHEMLLRTFRVSRV